MSEADDPDGFERVVRQRISQALRRKQREKRKAEPNGHESAEVPLTIDQKRNVISELAKLDLLNFVDQHKRQAKRLGVSLRLLEKLVQIERDKDGGADTKGQGRPLDLPAPEPWPKPVDGDQLLQELTAFFTQYAVLPTCAATALALWTVHCHCFTTWRITPRMHIKSAVKGSGKSTVLELLGYVVPKPLETASASSAALFRATELAQPTLVMDEADLWINQDQELRAFINAGHKEGMQTLRCVGDVQEVRQFNCHAPAALASIGNLPDTIEDRSIRISMQRRLASEALTPIDDATRETAARLLRQSARWVRDHGKALRAARPDMGKLINRIADRWYPLYAIASVAAGDWPEQVRAAQAALDQIDDNASQGEALLADIKRVFDDAMPATELTTGDLVDRLTAMLDRPWAEMGKTGKPLTAARLTRMLARFTVLRRRFWVDGKAGPWGYRLTDFQDAFDRYLTA
jgi:putative DNA primase/helicase